MLSLTHGCRVYFPALASLMLLLLVAACGGAPQPAATGAPPTQSATKPPQAAASSAPPSPTAAPVAAPTAPAAQSTQQPITLKFAHQFQVTHPTNKIGIEPWIQRVTELTGGKVKIEHYPAEQLGKRADQLKLIKAGVAEIVGISATIFPGEFPLSAVGALPTLYNTSAAGTKAFNTLLKQGPLKAEHDKHAVTPLFYYAPTQYEINSTKKEVVKLEDLKGMKIRTLGGPQVDAVQLVGAVSVNVPATDTFVAMQRGTVDAALFPFSSVKEYKLDELVKFATFGAPFTPGMSGFVIRTDVWNKLAPETRDAITKANQEAIDHLIKFNDEDAEQTMKAFAARGIKIARLPADEQARWAKALAPVIEKWEKEMAAQGLPGREVREAFLKAAQ